MRRLAGISAVVVLLTCAPVWAQRRGGGGSFHGGVAFHGAVAPRGGVISNGFPRTGITIRTFPGPFTHFHHRFPYYRPWWGYGYAGYYGYGYPGYYGAYGYYDPLLWGSASSYSYDTSSEANANYGQTQQLQQQVNNLQNEVERLREERYAQPTAPLSPAVPAAPAAPAKPESASMTVLVFKDQHREEVKNYAVVGQTVWIFSEQRARKVPLQQLDVPATQQANEERGVDFLIPG